MLVRKVAASALSEALTNAIASALAVQNPRR
jgi:hypothetical protein